MGQIVRGDTIHDEERIKLLNKIITKLKEIEESIPVKIKEAIDALVDNSPEAYDTLKELYEGLILQPDWEQSDNTKLDYIKNKPTIPEQVKSDWNENDNTKASYIQNRTHYEDVNMIEEYETTFLIYGVATDNNTEKIGYKVINIDTNVFDIEFYKESEFLTKERIVSDGTTNIILNTQAKKANYNRDHYIVDSDYSSINFNVQSQQISIINVEFDTIPINGIIYEAIGHERTVVRKLKYDKIEENVHQLDIKYIPDSLIQRIEACEQALNITPNP